MPWHLKPDDLWGGSAIIILNLSDKADPAVAVSRTRYVGV